jgi:hypothetical protein
MGIATFNIFNYNHLYESILGIIVLFSLYTFNYISNNIDGLYKFTSINADIYYNLFLSSIVGFMFPFGLLYIYHYIDSYLFIILYTILLYYTSNIDFLFLLLLSCFIFVCILYLIGCLFGIYKNCSVDKEIIIIRGVPGIGKKYFIGYNELFIHSAGKFNICYWQDYFGIGDNYKFNVLNIKKAEMWSIIRFITYLSKKINRIYIISTFEYKWQYDVYVYIGLLMGYNYKIVELVCNNLDELKLYQQRSTHNIPYSRSLKVFNEWENDDRCIKYKPYINDNNKGYGYITDEDIKLLGI